jgi:hypothetical protein
MSEQLVTTVPTSHWDTSVQMYWSSSAEAPKFWLHFQGGESVDPRDPKRLATLPLTDTVLLGVKQAKALQVALGEWIERLESTDLDNYLGEDDDS